MKEYLKMGDYFNAAMSAPVSTDDEMYCSDSFIAEFTCRSHAIAASHAINSHDELVDSLQSVTKERDELAKEVERLRSALEMLYHDGVNFIGAEDLDDEEDAAEMQGKFNDSLIVVSDILK